MHLLNDHVIDGFGELVRLIWDLYKKQKAINITIGQRGQFLDVPKLCVNQIEQMDAKLVLVFWLELKSIWHLRPLSWQ